MSEDNFDYGQFDQNVDGSKSVAEGGSAVPDGDYVFQIKKLRRYPTKGKKVGNDTIKDVMVVLDVSVVAYKEGSAITRKYTGQELEISYYLPSKRWEDKTKILKMNTDRLMSDLTKIFGGVPQGSFSADFENWAKQATGLCFVCAQRTSSEKNDQGKYFVNYNVDRSYSLTPDDQAAMGLSAAKPGAVVPF